MWHERKKCLQGNIERNKHWRITKLLRIRTSGMELNPSSLVTRSCLTAQDLVIEKGIVCKALEYLHSQTAPKPFRTRGSFIHYNFVKELEVLDMKTTLNLKALHGEKQKPPW